MSGACGSHRGRDADEPHSQIPRGYVGAVPSLPQWRVHAMTNKILFWSTALVFLAARSSAQSASPADTSVEQRVVLVEFVESAREGAFEGKLDLGGLATSLLQLRLTGLGAVRVDRVKALPLCTGEAAFRLQSSLTPVTTTTTPDDNDQALDRGTGVYFSVEGSVTVTFGDVLLSYRVDKWDGCNRISLLDDSIPVRSQELYQALPEMAESIGLKLRHETAVRLPVILRPLSAVGKEASR